MFALDVSCIAVAAADQDVRQEAQCGSVAPDAQLNGEPCLIRQQLHRIVYTVAVQRTTADVGDKE